LINPGETFTQKRVPSEKVSNARLLEASDIGKLVAIILTLSPQVVVKEININIIGKISSSCDKSS
jgi:NADP-dependent 3-hydroxy acid dehydrogenase YdfG